MINEEQFNCITVAPEATSREWMGMFVGVPSKEDIIVAIELNIKRLLAGGLEHEQDEAEDYRIAMQVVVNSAFNHIKEDIEVAGIRIGTIQCTRLNCYMVREETLRCV